MAALRSLPLSCECTLQLQHFRPALRFRVFFDVQYRAKVSFVMMNFSHKSDRPVAKPSYTGHSEGDVRKCALFYIFGEKDYFILHLLVLYIRLL